jgi:hypothetical protein
MRVIVQYGGGAGSSRKQDKRTRMEAWQGGCWKTVQVVIVNKVVSRKAIAMVSVLLSPSLRDDRVGTNETAIRGRAFEK